MFPPPDPPHAGCQCDDIEAEISESDWDVFAQRLALAYADLEGECDEANCPIVRVARDRSICTNGALRARLTGDS